jgi:hypothetical protein
MKKIEIARNLNALIVRLIKPVKRTWRMLKIVRWKQ